jgi:hypothetical protein
MKLSFTHLLESLLSWIEIHFERKYLMRRLDATEAWRVRMVILCVLVAISMSVVFSLCTKTPLLDGVGLGLLCLLPMLFFLLVPFLVALFIVKITGSPQPHIALAVFFHPPYLFVPRVYLQVPLSPPRFRLA